MPRRRLGDILIDWGRVTFVVAMPSQVQALLHRIWGDEGRAAVVDALVDQLTGVPVAGGAVDDEGAVGIVDQILLDAVNRRASDIHIERASEFLRPRLRVDGITNLMLELPAASQMPIANRVKVICGLDVFQKRIPQDGRARVEVKGHELDLRVSTVPTIHGESIVMRLMTSQKELPDISKMGVSWEQVDLLASAMAKPQGFVIVTGPTGSGKSTTLYLLMP